MRIDIITLFPEMFRGPFDASIIARAREQGIVQIELHNLRDWGEGKHHTVDDAPYGGGAGMVLKPQPLFEAVEAVQPQAEPPGRVVLLTPQGRLLNQSIVQELAAVPRLLLICGHYEGVDERVHEHLVDDEISIGDYVLSGGETAAMVLVDAVVRLLPGALGGEASLAEESHAQGLLEYPQYTRPADFRGWSIPGVLLSGNHPEVDRWRRKQSVLRTARRRADLLDGACLTEEERSWLVEEKAELPDENWYSARLLYEIVVDDAGEHKPKFEETLIVFRCKEANDSPGIVEQVVALAKEHDEEYDNGYGQRVHWIFREILEIQDVMERRLRDGAEVFYRFWDNPSARTFRILRRTSAKPWRADEDPADEHASDTRSLEMGSDSSLRSE